MFDKNEEWIEEHIAGPRRQGRAILFDGRVLEWSDIWAIHIMHTAEVVKTDERRTTASGLVIPGTEWDSVFDKGTDVTHRFITGAPGTQELRQDPSHAQARGADIMSVMRTTPSATAHAFISYVHEDSELVDALCDVLEAASIAVWRDREQLWPGDEWKVQIRRATQRGSLAFIACFSEHSVAKERSYQNEELVLAVDEYRKRTPGHPWLFPVRFDDVDLPEFDLGAGRTLDSLQRTDLFGAKREPELTRLAVRISSVINASQSLSVPSNPTPEPDDSKGKASKDKLEVIADSPVHISPSSRVKQLLRDPTKDIELDDYVTEMADTARRRCLDGAVFPTSADEMRASISAATFVINRVDQYWKIIEELTGVLATGCAWGAPNQDPLWSRTMRTMANITPLEGGQTVLLNLRAYPRIIVMYAAGLGALARDQYSALRAVTVDARYRDQGRSVPVIGVCHPLLPFSDAPFLASAIARKTAGEALSDADIEALSRGTKGVRLTPVSDDLHDRLRETVKPIIRDDEDYGDIFDKLEALLGVVAQDAAIVEASAGGYLHGGWTGRYIWRKQFGKNAFEQIYDEFSNRGSSWAPIRSGLFDGSAERAERAFVAMSERVVEARRRQW
jgi:TIR domain